MFEEYRSLKHEEHGNQMFLTEKELRQSPIFEVIYSILLINIFYLKLFKIYLLFREVNQLVEQYYKHYVHYKELN